MSHFVISPAACLDLDEIWNYYAADLQNPDAADRIRDEIFAAFDKLARTPGIGHLRNDLAREPLLFWHVRSYLIVTAAKSGHWKLCASSTERETWKRFWETTLFVRNLVSNRCSWD
jgi:antitoxin ParD1/3/4/toxin ParE1/3/4